MNIQKFLNKTVRRLRFLITQITLLFSYLYLVRTKRNQKRTFKALKNQYSQYYNYLSRQDISDFTTPFWENYNKKIEKAITPYPPFSFLLNRAIRETMFVVAGGKWINEELVFLEKLISKEKLRKFLEEDYVGIPILINSTYLTSHNSIHHLYHLIYFQNKTRIDFNRIDTVIEWGGGYGNMAKLFKRINPGITYIIIDLPLLTCLQWLYLAVILGEDKINILKNTTEEIKEGKINLLPVCFLKNYNLKGDLFIATWSLSESSRYAQDYVENHKFFGAKHFLFGYQKGGKELPYADRLGEIALKQGGVIYPIKFLPGCYYAFK